MKIATKPERTAFGSRNAYKQARNEWRRQCRRNPPSRRKSK